MNFNSTIDIWVIKWKKLSFPCIAINKSLLKKPVKSQAILSDRTINSSAVQPEELKPCYKSKEGKFLQVIIYKFLKDFNHNKKFTRP